jgi:hypothetical protein
MKSALLLYSSLVRVRDAVVAAGANEFASREALATAAKSGWVPKWTSEFEGTFDKMYHWSDVGQTEAFRHALGATFVRNPGLVQSITLPAARFLAAVIASEVIGLDTRLDEHLVKILGLPEDGAEAPELALEPPAPTL